MFVWYHEYSGIVKVGKGQVVTQFEAYGYSSNDTRPKHLNRLTVQHSKRKWDLGVDGRLPNTRKPLAN